MSIERTACKTNDSFIWPDPCAFAAEYSHCVSDPFFGNKSWHHRHYNRWRMRGCLRIFVSTPAAQLCWKRLVPQWSRNGCTIWHWVFCVSNFWQDEDKSGHSYALNTAGLKVCLLFRIQTSSYQRMFRFMVVNFYLQGVYNGCQPLLKSDPTCWIKYPMVDYGSSIC